MSSPWSLLSPGNPDQPVAQPLARLSPSSPALSACRDHDPAATWLGPGFGELDDDDGDLAGLEDADDTDPDDLAPLPTLPPFAPPFPLLPPLVTTVHIRRHQLAPRVHSASFTLVWRRPTSSPWRILVVALTTLALTAASAFASHYLFSKLLD